MKKNLPVFEFLIDDSIETGVKTVSIVADPAFGSSAVFFEKNRPKYVALQDKKKQIVAGLSLIPNTPVYRYDAIEDLEYYGYFTAETIEKIVDRFHQEMLQNQVNINHDENSYIDAYMVEDYIVNSEARINDLKAMGIEHPNIMGAWYTAFKIKDQKMFEAIENSGQGTGFSVEAYLDKVISKFNSDVKNKLVDNKVKKEMKKINKSLKEKILSIFADFEIFERALVPELAFEIEWQEVGQPVNKVVVDENGNETLQPVGKGEFVTEMGIVVVDEASNLVEVREMPMQPEEPVVETPEAPTSGDTSMAVSGDTSAPNAEIPPVSGTTGTTSGDSLNVISPVARGIDKSILEVVGGKDGEYTILVTVTNGNVESATLQSMADLMLEKQNEINALKLKNEELETKLKAPIGDPILNPEEKPIDFSKMSAYEKSMYRKGLKAI